MDPKQKFQELFKKLLIIMSIGFFIFGIIAISFFAILLGSNMNFYGKVFEYGIFVMYYLVGFGSVAMFGFVVRCLKFFQLANLQTCNGTGKNVRTHEFPVLKRLTNINSQPA